VGVEPVLTRNMKPGRTPVSLADYEKAGGYSALRTALTRYSPPEIVKLVTDSNLRGRGGAGFPTGRKWAALVPAERSRRPRLLMVNFDEMEPGTYKDRFLVEGDPHQLIEGTLIAGYACQADIAYIFVRGEYVTPIRALEQALAEAEQAGYVGRNILGRGFDFEIRLHTSAGRYMCGEETGLLNAIEGKPANPRTKPPYPVTSGAWGLPTVINNVETLCCVPHIVERGAEWFRGLGKAKDAGTKIYGMSGRVKRPGSWELPIGTTLRELLTEHAGGMQEGVGFRAALPGGASTMFLDVAQMDVPLEYESLAQINCFFGTGSAIVLDDRTCVVGMVHNLQQFFARESCGWCTPCREGLPWVRDLLGGLEQGQGRPGDLELLEDQAHYIHGNTFCALALGAMVSLESSLQKFRADYEEHLRAPRCPWKDKR
jgi:NADH-quinone oxidoreductase subunit F